MTLFELKCKTQEELLTELEDFNVQLIHKYVNDNTYICLQVMNAGIDIQFVNPENIFVKYFIYDIRYYSVKHFHSIQDFISWKNSTNIRNLVKNLLRFDRKIKDFNKEIQIEFNKLINTNITTIFNV